MLPGQPEQRARRDLQDSKERKVQQVQLEHRVRAVRPAPESAIRRSCQPPAASASTQASVKTLTHFLPVHSCQALHS